MTEFDVCESCGDPLHHLPGCEFAESDKAMTTTQERAPGGVLTADDLKKLIAAKEFCTRLEAAADKTPFTCTPERLAAAAIAITGLCGIIERLENAALRQPQAARLTEELRDIVDLIDEGMGDTDPSDDDDPLLKASQKIWAILDSGRLTAAPASQVTREEIAWIVFEAKAGPYLTHWPAVYSSSWTFKAADAIMSLLASRGLVKG